MRWYLLAIPILDLTIKKQMPMWQLPLQQFFLKSISASSGNAKSKAPNKPQLWCMLLPDDWVSLQKVIKQHSPAAKAFWGLACKEGLRCGDRWRSLSVTDQNFQLCYSSASHTLLPRRHMEAQRPKAGVRMPMSRASTSVQAASPRPPQTPHLKGALLKPHLESLLVLTSDSRSILRALVLRS